MNYINFDFLIKQGLTSNDYLLLQMVAQKEFALLPTDNNKYNLLIENGLIQFKGDKNRIPDDIRISAKGKKLLDNTAIPHYHEDVEELIDKLIDVYEVRGLGDRVGKRTVLASRLSWFLHQTGFSIPVIVKEVDIYIQNLLNRGDERFIRSLPNLIWKGEGVYNSNYYLTQSVLYDMICERYGLNKKMALNSSSTSKLTQYLYDVSRLNPPKNNNKLYFTGSWEKDIEFINRMKEELYKLWKN